MKQLFIKAYDYIAYTYRFLFLCSFSCEYVISYIFFSITFQPWKTYVYDLGMTCTFYLRAHLDYLRKQRHPSVTQIQLNRQVSERQASKFQHDTRKRKKKHREQDEEHGKRSRSVLEWFRHLNLKPETSTMDEWWFPKELKLEILEVSMCEKSLV
jgi:hypothetical protein